MKTMGMKGITLIELMVVIGISSIIMGIAGFSAQTYRDRYQVESQIRQMHADMLKARASAFETNKNYFVKVTSDSYEVIEDTDGNGTPDAGDAIVQEPKKLKYQARWTGIVVMNTRGLLSTSSGPILGSNPVSIRLDSAGIDPEYDCISAGPTRVGIGKWNGKKCIIK